jgi:hypothetical protein
MSIRILFASLATAALLGACGGDAPPAAGASTKLLATSNSSAATPLAYAGTRADYSITGTDGGYTVRDRASGEETFVPRNARVRFADTSVAFDLDGVAGRVFRLYRAAFDRVPDPAGIGYWIAVMDGGADPAQVAGAFMQSDEFKARYGADLDDSQFIGKLYQNVLHRDGDPAGIAYWAGLLGRGAITRPQALAGFGESAESKAMLSGAIRGGIYFLEDGVPYLPAADAGASRVVDLGSRVVLDGSGSTVAIGKQMRYYWTFGAKPIGSGAVLEGASTAHPSFVADVGGKYELKLVVSDGNDYSREARTTVAAAWRPDEAQLPASGNLIYLESENGDPVGRGESFAYTQANAVISVDTQGRHFNFNVTGDANWWAYMSVPMGLAKLAPGYYGELGTDTWSEQGGFSWSQSGAGCNGASSWIVIDSVTYDGDRLVWLDMRFGQRCRGSFGVLHGHIRWSPDDPTRPAGPVNPPPAGLWQAAAGATPASGNYVYLESTPGDPVGNGQTYTRTDDGNGFSVSAEGARVYVRMDGSSWWNGTFAAMNTVSRITPGYYGNVQSYPGYNPTRAAMSWYSWTSCNSIKGWYVVDKATYSAGVLTELDLRFEQYCNGKTAPLNGQVHWRAP